MGGLPLKTQMLEIAQVNNGLTAEEVATCMLNAMNGAFCVDEIKREFGKKMQTWSRDHRIQLSQDLLPKAIITQTDNAKLQLPRIHRNKINIYSVLSCLMEQKIAWNETVDTHVKTLAR